MASLRQSRGAAFVLEGLEVVEAVRCVAGGVLAALQVSGGVDGDVDAIPQGCNVLKGAMWHHARIGESPRGRCGRLFARPLALGMAVASRPTMGSSANASMTARP